MDIETTGNHLDVSKGGAQEREDPRIPLVVSYFLVED